MTTEISQWEGILYYNIVEEKKYLLWSWLFRTKTCVSHLPLYTKFWEQNAVISIEIGTSVVFNTILIALSNYFKCWWFLVANSHEFKQRHLYVFVRSAYAPVTGMLRGASCFFLIIICFYMIHIVQIHTPLRNSYVFLWDQVDNFAWGTRAKSSTLWTSHWVSFCWTEPI